MLIVALILGLACFLLWRAQVRASKSAASYSKQAEQLMAARTEYERVLRACCSRRFCGGGLPVLKMFLVALAAVIFGSIWNWAFGIAVAKIFL